MQIVITTFLGCMVGAEYGSEDDVILVDIFFLRFIFFLSGYPED